MKNIFTICTLLFAVALMPDSRLFALQQSAGHTLNQTNKCYVMHPDRTFGDLFPWEADLLSAAVMMPCPSTIDVDLGPGECGSLVNFNFGFPDISVSNLSYNLNADPNTVNSTIYCGTGQTSYTRLFNHAGPTDLQITSIRLGVYQSLNSPSVTVNFYNFSGQLLGSESAVIPNLNTAIYTINVVPGNIIKIPATSQFYVEIVANAPYISVFKIGRNNSGHVLGGTDAIIQSNCLAPDLIVEGPVGTPLTNSIVFGVSGTPDDYLFDNLNNNFASGDFFPIGDHVMSYLVTDANGSSTGCAFNININEYDEITGALACDDFVQVSLDANCETIVTPEMLLEGGEYGCYDKYKVQIIGVNGIILGNKVTKANIGQRLKVQIIGPNGNSCWGEILVEDKFGPELICEDIYATCSTDLRPGSPLSERVPVVADIEDGTIGTAPFLINTITIPVAHLQGTTITDLNVYVDIKHSRVSDLAANITSPDGVTVPLFFNLNCTGQDLMVTLDDEANNLNSTLQTTCEPADPAVAGVFQPYNPLSAFIGKPLQGDWKVTIYDLVAGESGVINNVHLIFSQNGGKVPFPTPKPVTFAQVSDKIYIVKGIDECFDATLAYTDEIVEEDCSSIYSKIIRRCWTGFDTKGNQSIPCCQLIYVYRNSLSTLQFPPNFDGLNGNPAPLSCRDYGTTIPPVSVTGLPDGDLCDNVQIAAPVDTKIELCEKSYKLLRTHKVVEWCSGQVIIHNQIIKVLDEEGPELDCPADVTLSTDDYDCAATYTVPRPIVSNECSDDLIYRLSYSYDINNEEDFLTSGVNQATSTITGLPLGSTWVKWTVTDECGNYSECLFLVTVVDRVLPSAVCDQFTVASITGNGKAIVDAFTFDDGSTDNCGIFKFEARKMTDKCNFGTTVFTPAVEFCCEEVNTSVMVEMRVTDVHGNTNTCMVEVRVQDKLPPYITKCPADITLDCQADYKDLKITGEPTYVDNCEVISVKSQDVVRITQCGVGTVTRTWTVEDKQGYKNSCVQVITLIDKNPFKASEIIWPKNYETKKCHSNLDPEDLPEGFNKPTFSDDNCSLVAAHYKDQVFKFVDGACEKVIRTWTVIDWCTYNDANPVFGQGWYEHIQIIKLQNDIPPIFEFACVDRTFASYGNCEDVVDFTMTAVDDCPENNTNLVWKYELYTENGLVPIAVVNSDRFFRTLANGKYRVKWTVEDRCGNRAFCTHYVNVIESKKPTPYCISSLTTAVMNSNGTISIWAKDYDKGAFDNCTPQNQLIFTFYGATPVDTLINKEHYFKGEGILATKAEYEAGNAQIWIPLNRTSGIRFDCADIPNGVSQEISVEVWVTDLAGNQDYCTVTLDLQDNANVCPNGTSTFIAINGKVSLGANSMNNVDVTIESNVTEQNKTIKSDAYGSFSFANLPKANNYVVSISDNRNILNGVSTLDLVMIQRHILGMDVLNDPKKIIAADVDNNAKVTASDLVNLRKNILGITTEFPNGQKSWRFVTSNHIFSDPANPFPFTEKYVYNQLIENKVNQNFYGIKIGDVNNSAVANVTDTHLEPRSNQNLILSTEPISVIKGQEIQIPVYAESFDNIVGYQFTLNYDASMYTFVDVQGEAIHVSESNFGLNRTESGIITTSWNSEEPVTVKKGEVLFTLTFKVNKNATNENVVTISSDITPAIAYDDAYQAMKIKLENRSNSSDAAFELLQNTPNPFHDVTSVSFRLPEDGVALLTVTDISGKVLKVISNNYSKGSHTLQLSKAELGNTGVLLYKIESGKFTDTKKMIIID